MQPDRTSADPLPELRAAHDMLDALGVPRVDARGQPYPVLGRLEQLRAGHYDRSKVGVHPQSVPLHQCPGCGLYLLGGLGDACPSCHAPLAR